MTFGSTLPLAGVDEAGRGPLAGPVIAAAVALDPACPIKGLGDSKALSDKTRRALFLDIINSAHVGIGIAEPAEIDRVNILHATMAAMRRAVLDLGVAVEEIQIDGNRVPEHLPWPASAIVKGDAKVAAIGAASIIAKTVRDDLMIRADARFPGYGFARHKGYPSPMHREALDRLGPCPIHRMSYAPVRKAYESRQTQTANHCG